MPQMMNDTNDLPTCSPRPVGFAAGKNESLCATLQKISKITTPATPTPGVGTTLGGGAAAARAASKAVERLKTADADGWAEATIEMSSTERKWRPTRENYELQADYFFR